MIEINKTYLMDVMELMTKIDDNSIDMIYSDPDYNVGIKYNEKSYTKNFSEYIDWYINLAKESLRVLKEDGNMFFINYPKQNSHLWVKYLDSACYDVHEYVWIYNSNVGHTPRRFTTAHRTILHCRKSKNNKWFKDAVTEPYKNPTDKRIIQNIANGSKGRMPYTWMYFDLVKNVSKDKTIHSCQLPIGLFDKLMNASTQKGDIVFIHFGGSGNEIIYAKHSKRNFISAETDKLYHKMINDRIKLDGKIPPKYKLKIGKEKYDEIEYLTLFEKNKIKNKGVY
ncbi:MAG: site-specific DNA-methyltransferase [Ignavibacteria bacterium]|nr:site-specific DNA-methyltransferase [Ignavibacteria bacterium]